MQKREYTEIEVFCTFVDTDNRSVRMGASAVSLLHELECLGLPVPNDLDHPANAELDAQRALVRYVLLCQRPMVLHNDHWDHTLHIFIELLDSGKAFFISDGGMRWERATLKKSYWSDLKDWQVGNGAEGWTYSTSTGEILIRAATGYIFRDP